VPNFPILLTIIVVVVVSTARRAEATPADDLLNSLQPTGDVDDFAGVLSPEEKTSRAAALFAKRPAPNSSSRS